VLGTPVAAALLVAELSGQYLFFFPAIAATWLGMEIRARTRTFSLPELEAARRGLIIQGGRSTAVLDSIQVRDAMTTEFECVRGHETVQSLIGRIDTLRHPFFPVLDAAGKYIGITTLDEVMDAQNQAGGRASETSGALVSLLEVKDLLYRSGWRSPTIIASQPLSSVQGLFEETPCIPVLSEDRKVVGLLFVHQVRLAYDREVGRKSLGLRSSG
jgi:CBS domain-containing protein